MAVCLLLPQFSAYAALPGIAGTVNLGYRDYNIKDGTSKEDKGDSFHQKYSLVATKRGNLYNRRGGPYHLTFTYDHLKFLTDVNGTDYSLSESFLGWNGGLALTMPHLYGLDLTYASSRARAFSVDNEALSGHLDTGLASDIFLSDVDNSSFNLSLGTNGGPYYYFSQSSYEQFDEDVKTESFKRLMVGMEYGVNGLYLYQDKEALDGREINTFVLGNLGMRDLSARGIPEKLAYSSGNSRSGQSDLQRSSPADVRLWYTLTNWLEISTDILYSEEENKDEDISTKKVTLALKGSVGPTSIGTYSLHERVDSDSQSTRLIHLPFWLDHRVSPRTEVYFSNNYDYSQTKDMVTLAVKQTRVIKESLSLFSKPDKTTTLEAEYTFGKGENSDDFREETHSIYLSGNKLQVKGVDYTLSYRHDIALAAHAVDDAGAGTFYSGTSSSSDTLQVSATYAPSPSIRFHLSQGYLKTYMRDSGWSERFTTLFRLDHRSSVGSAYFLDILRTNLLNEDGSEEIEYGIDTSFDKDLGKKMHLNINVTYNQNEIKSDTNSESSSSRVLSSIDYKLQRSLMSRTSIEVNTSDSDPGSSASTLTLGEHLDYSYYLSGFRKRKLFDLAGSVWFTKADSTDSQWMQVQARYYPTIYFYCGAAYSTVNEASTSSDDNSGLKTLYFALTYSLMTFNGSYSQQLHGDGDIEENLYQLDFTKKF